MAIRVRVAGLFLGQSMNESFDESYAGNDTPRKVFACLDKKKALGRNFFKRVVKKGEATFLLNGDRLNMPEASNKRLNDGDEISVLSAIAGG